MSLFKVISEKIAKKEIITTASFINYTNSLNQAVKQQPGFISSNSYFKEPLKHYSDKITLITISEWATDSHWEQWYNCNDRRNIQRQYTQYVEHENFHRIFKKNQLRDVFLL